MLFCIIVGLFPSVFFGLFGKVAIGLFGGLFLSTLVYIAILRHPDKGPWRDTFVRSYRAFAEEVNGMLIKTEAKFLRRVLPAMPQAVPSPIGGQTLGSTSRA